MIVILRELAGVFRYLACDKVKEHVAFFFGEVSDALLPRFKFLTVGAFFVTGAATASVTFCPTVTMGAEYVSRGNLISTPASLITKVLSTSFVSVPRVTLVERALSRALSVFSIPHSFNIPVDTKAVKLPLFSVPSDRR